MTTIAERLAEAMQRRGLTPGMLAIKTGISDRMVRNYLKGVHHPGGYSLQKLAKGLGVSVDWLLGIKEEDDKQ
jgi:transcriptional regulator with XRE-family HTH domain